MSVSSVIPFPNEMQAVPQAWYCARTKPKHEHIAAANVARALGVEVFHPRLRLERATRRGTMRIVESLFPCYIFVRCSLEAHFNDLKHVSGISSLVRFGHKIPSVPEDSIFELKQCFESEEPMMVDDALTAGAEVTIADGAFCGFSGMVVRSLPAGQRVQILLDFLGRATLTEVDRRALKVENRRVADMLPLLANGGMRDAAAVG